VSSAASLPLWATGVISRVVLVGVVVIVMVVGCRRGGAPSDSASPIGDARETTAPTFQQPLESQGPRTDTLAPMTDPLGLMTAWRDLMDASLAPLDDRDGDSPVPGLRSGGDVVPALHACQVKGMCEGVSAECRGWEWL
jgi:hypothetical protein